MKRIAIISGASDGIGREFARTLATRGEADELWLIARRADRMQTLAGALGLPCRIFPLDLAVPGAVQELCLALAGALGVPSGEMAPSAGCTARVTWLVASAGFGKIGEFTALGADHLRDMVTVNCTALTELLHAALPYMAAGGHVVTLASAAAFMPQPRFAVYAATKAYVLSLSRALGEELRPRGICVTAVCPGPVRTGFFGVAEETGHMNLQKERLMTTPGRVVRAAYRAAVRGRGVCTPTATMRFARLAAKLLPHKLLMKFF